MAGSQDSGGGDKVLDIRTDDIKSVAPVFHEQSKKLSDALTKLIGTLDGLGEPWGKDDAGEQFAAAYSPQQKAIEQATGTLVMGLVSIHEALNDMADGHVDNDQLIAGMFSRAKPGDGSTSGRDSGRGAE
ncbi:hypothetical protein ABZ502_18875 [Streptomyces abikoensis]|uniref:hypothetical protein n=1 Tax=Streptomyces abikoensis TaxID=97398 RepID=UPI003407C279